jgi:RNA polymerase sigma-70 factor (ECF subfamily)
VDDPHADLVARAQRGDQKAFAELVQETQSRVYSLAYRILNNHQEAEDASQEVYLRAWRALPEFRGDSKFTTWLYRVATNTCLNHRRDLRRSFRVVDDEDLLARQESACDGPAAAVIKRDYCSFIWAAVEHLPAKYRTVIALFYQQGLSYDEIAGTLSLPLGTVKSHLSRARRALAKRLRPEEVEDDTV